MSKIKDVSQFKNLLRKLSQGLLMLCFYILPQLSVLAQSPADNWFFGTNAGVSFTGGAPVALGGGMISSAEGVASISNAAGTILFYTDGVTVFNQSNIAMPNGTGLLGGSSSSQSAVAVQKPGSLSVYYLFTADQDGGPDGIRYSIIDMNLNGGLGDVVSGQKNILLLAPATEKLTAVRHCNKRDNWIIAHDWGTNQFYSWLVTPAGVSATPVVSSVGVIHNQSVIGCLKVAPNGSKLATAIYDQGGQHLVQVFDFNSNTGQVTNPFTLNLNGSAYGLEFSPKGQYLYFTSAATQATATISINQIDLCAGTTNDILASETTVGSTSDGFIRSLQLGPDGKLYFSRFGQSWIGVISNPDIAAPGCGFLPSGVSLGPGVCRAGLPNFNQSFFNPELDFISSSTCLAASFSAQTIIDNSSCLNPITSLSWNFGEPSSGASNISTLNAPNHTYTNPGNYSVRLILNYPCGSDTIYQSINIQCGLQVSVSNQSVCPGACVNLQANVSGGTAPFTWTWTGVSATTAGPISVCPTATTTYTATVTDFNGLSASSTATVTVNSLPNATVSITPVTCNGLSNGGATITIPGGPYTFLWNSSPSQTTSSITNVPAGVYNATITGSNGCQRQVSANIVQPAILNVNAHVINSSCGLSNGSSTAIPFGGTMPYSYSWNTAPVQTTATATGLPQGNYHVDVVDANGCTNSADVFVENHATHSAYIDFIQSITCNGGSDGSLMAIPISGTPPFTYLWSNGQTSQIATGLSAGTHSVQVADADNCPITYSYFIDDAPGMGIQVNVTNPTCGQSDGSASLTLSGGYGPFLINWASSPSQNVMSIGNIHVGPSSVSILDQIGCTYTTDFVITSSSAPSIQITPSQIITCNGASNGSLTAVATGGVGPYTYTWSNGALTASISNLGPGNYTCIVSDASGCSVNASYQLVDPSPIVINANTIPASCGQSNGSILLTVSGGTAPYQYAWLSGQNTQDITNLAAGSYTVTVTGSGSCTQQSTVNLTAAGAPNITIVNNSPALCFGDNTGSAEINVVGGTAPYSIVWSDAGVGLTRSSLSAGNYTVTATDALGCVNQLNISILEPPAISASWNLIASSCNLTNGSAEVVVSGGTGAYSYVWSSGEITSVLSNQVAGNVSVIVSDASGCQQTFNETIVGSGGITSNISTVSSINCNGASNGELIVNIVGGQAPFSYSWSNGAITANNSNLNAGNYSVLVSDASGCQSSASFNLTEPAGLTSISNATASTCGLSNGSISLAISGGQAPYQVLWSDGQTNFIAQSLASGNYTATITDASNCSIVINSTVSDAGGPTLSLSSSNDVSCFGLNDGSVDIAANGGVLPYNVLWTDGATSLTRNNLQAGNYSLTVSDGNGCSSQISVVIDEPAALVETWIIQAESCSSGNGSASISISGGLAPYSFLWMDGTTASSIQSQTAGIVSVIVNDANSCSSTYNGVIDAVSATPASISVSSSVTCHDSSDATIQVVSNQPVQVTWADGGNTSGRSNVPPGDYTAFTVDDAGCLDTLTVTVFNPPALIASIVTSDATCSANDGSAQVNYSGGTGSLSVQWVNGSTSSLISNLGFGPVSVVVSDVNGCNINVTSQIGTISPLTIDTIIVSSPSCIGFADAIATVQVSGNTGTVNAAWSNGSTGLQTTNLSAGNYTLTITDASGCMTWRDFQVADPLQMTTQVVTSDAPCYGNSSGQASITISGGTSPYSALWPDAQVSFSRNDLSAGNYSVIIEDALGCQISEDVLIGQADSLSGIIITQPATCGTASGSATINLSGGTLPYFYMWNNSSVSNQASNLASGTANVLVTDANGCQKNFNAQISSAAAATVQLLVNQQVSCFGGTDAEIEITSSSPVSVQWNDGNSNLLRTGLSIGSFTAITTDAGGCRDTLTAIISQPNLLAATFSVLPATCLAADGSAAVSVNGGTSPYSYLWSNGATLNVNSGVSSGLLNLQITDANSCVLSVNTTIQSVNPLLIDSILVTNASCFGMSNGAASAQISGATGAAIYAWSNGESTSSVVDLLADNYSLQVSDQAGCIASKSFVIDAPSALDVSVLHEDVSCFELSDGVATAFAIGGSMPYSYTWNGVNGSDIKSGLAAGELTLLVSDANNCSTQESVTITQPELLIVIIDVQPSTCGLANGTLDTEVIGGTSPYQYSWSNGNNETLLNGLLPGTYTLTITDANGCEAGLTKSFFDVGPPTIDLLNASNISCFGGNNGSIEVEVAGGSEPLSVVWAGGENGNNLNDLPFGNYSATVTDALGCTAEFNHSLTQPTAIVANFQSSDVLCFGGYSGSIVSHITGGTPNYTTEIYVLGETIQQLPNNLNANVYTVTITDANACLLFDTITISEPSQLSTQINSTDVLCFGGSDGSAEVIATGGTSPYEYLWSNGSADSQIDSLTTSTYIVTVTDSNLCQRSESIFVDQPDLLQVFITGVDEICTNEQVSFSIYGTGGFGEYHAEWMTGSTLESIDFIADSSVQISVLLIDENQCQATANLNLQVHALPVIELTPMSSTSCSGECVQVQCAPVSGGIYNWSTGLGAQANGQLVSFCFEEEGNIDLNLQVTDNHGCLSNTTFTDYFTIHPLPTASFSVSDSNIPLLDALIHFTNTSENAVSSVWNFDERIEGEESVQMSASYLFTEIGSYPVTLTVLNEFGCADQTIRWVNVKEDFAIYLPNAFTPNADGLNDGFIPQGIGYESKNYRFEIFDRWGKSVFVTNDHFKAWDGSHELNPGSDQIKNEVFVWKLQLEDFQGQMHDYSGSVTLVR